MSKFILLLIIVSSLLMGQREKADPKQPKIALRPIPRAPVVKRHPDGRPLGVPWEAVKISEGAWRIVENGEPAIYRYGAFGIYKLTEAENVIAQSRLDGKPIESATATPPENVYVVEEGDKLRFRTKTPFGPGPEWVKDKTDLTPLEKLIWEKHRGSTKK